MDFIFVFGTTKDLGSKSRSNKHLNIFKISYLINKKYLKFVARIIKENIFFKKK